jgi:hypothetical protein
MNKRSEEANKRSEEAKKRSEEANKRSEEANKRSDKANAEAIESINNALSAIIDFYNYYQISPDQKRLDSFMHNVEEIISLCKKY